MKHILQIPGGMLNRNDGISNFIMNIYRHIDKNKYQFDFLVMGDADTKGDYDDEIMSLGGRIYCAERLGKNMIQHMKQAYDIMCEEDYLAIHRHTAVSLSWPDFYVAKKAGIKNRICHSHGTSCGISGMEPMLHRLCYPIFIKNITHKLACGAEAGRWLYHYDETVLIQKNGIDTEKFRFNQNIREEQRKILGVDQETLVIGNVGRMAVEKNQTRLLEIFSEVIKQKKKSLLILLGEGSLKSQLKEQAKKLDIEDKVLFPGVTDDVSRWLCAMDVVVYPSLFEGFPISVLEGETSGLQTIISNKIPGEINISGNLIQLSLQQDKKDWAKAVLEAYEKSKTFSRENCHQQISKAGYDIKNTVKELEAFYDGLG